ncbi:PQQ-dependent sugar dehydrogenase [Nitrosococcus watsonii]|uniref:Glucose/Sorbosone dehydrogenase domain-containing protein n=1 Tax=Nitrosococcus watsoni (strain C-113) TaxID=105559 RepID=D8K9C7_NITWC|nr:PQQ-dependent sugar dehydrogenase [Nitrosococcus watsonii]ADJ29270.1 hypothetical protein Nwat_2468 [Nitrosococcus watsonii C-113]
MHNRRSKASLHKQCRHNHGPVNVQCLAQLDNPWGMVFLPDSRLLITGKPGCLDDGKVTAVERIDMQRRIRDVIHAPDGAVLLLTDGDNADLLRLTPARQ